MIGKTLAHYQIVEKLGEGGMGVVYKARDAHLDRFVALKVLPPNKVADPERRRRFFQEAKAASALNHPNIITIHDITAAEGVDCIVMEYIDGKTLDTLIGHKGLPLNDTLRYAVQIADALEKAHGAGIIHRDLKPSNVMVTGKGLIKVLDFGLAKLTEPTSRDESSATQTVHIGEPPRTDEGTILGTVAYMSPEQAEGKKIDARSDVFSLGSMLYEMITGQRAFRGETRVSTLSAILRDDPKPLSQVTPGIPRELERVVSRCLRKDPERRFQHMDDVKIALDELREESESGAFAPANPVIRKRKRLLPAIAGVLALLVAGIGAVWWYNRNASRTHSDTPALRRLTSDPGLTTEPSLSPDGKLVAYASDRATGNDLDIWVQQLAGGEPIRLTHNEADDREPSFSPDGSQIAFRSDREGGGIYVVSTLGGTEHKIAGKGLRPRFSPDGKWIAYWTGDESLGGSGAGHVYVIASSGGVPREIHSELWLARNPAWSPDGKYLLLEGTDKPFWKEDRVYDWWIMPMDGHPPIRTGAVDALEKQKLVVRIITQLSVLPVPGLWTESGVIFSGTLGDSTNLWEIPVAPASQTITGPASRLTSGLGVQVEPSVSAGGPQITTRLAFTSITENVDIWSVPMDTNQAKVSGSLLQLTHDIASDIRPSISADGKRMVFNSNRSGNWDVWLKDLETGKETALVATPADEINPKITLDGSRVAYSVIDGQNTFLYVVSTTGGIPKKVCDHCYVMPWCADGRRITLNSFKLLDVETGRQTEIVKGTGFSAPRPSWDDRWITFYRNIDPTHTRMFIAPLREGVITEEPQWTAVNDGSTYDVVPEWSPDGGLMYFLSDRDGFRCLWAQRLEPVTKKPVGAAFAVQHFHSAHLSPRYVKPGQRAISVARDKIVLTMAEHLGNIWVQDLAR